MVNVEKIPENVLKMLYSPQTYMGTYGKSLI